MVSRKKFYLFRKIVENANSDKKPIYPLFLTAILYPFLKGFKNTFLINCRLNVEKWV